MPSTWRRNDTRRRSIPAALRVGQADLNALRFYRAPSTPYTRSLSSLGSGRSSLASVRSVFNIPGRRFLRGMLTLPLTRARSADVRRRFRRRRRRLYPRARNRMLRRSKN